MNHNSLIERQRGLVLLVAMIALVVLSLAAVALIRTVDSATIIAGNLAFKQSATSSGEAALIRANQWLAAQADAEPPVGLYNDNLAVGYYATMTSLTTARGYGSDQVFKALTDDAKWSDANSRAALVKCNGVDSDKDCSGNTIRYVIERMCSSSGPAAADQCLYGPDVESGSSKKGGAAGGPPKTASPMFRITARSVGPKNTVGYIQSFVY
jgi:type IV pilus assembly protein PilX